LLLLHIYTICFLGDLANKEEGEDESCDKPTTSRADKKVSALKTMCELKRPEVHNMSLYHTFLFIYE